MKSIALIILKFVISAVIRFVSGGSSGNAGTAIYSGDIISVAATISFLFISKINMQMNNNADKFIYNGYAGCQLFI